MNLGYFQTEGKEYVITTPQTPRPWVNVLFNDEYFVLLDQVGRGRTLYHDGENYTSLCSSENRYIYIRDNKTGSFWSAGWYPGNIELDEFKCVHGIGYSRITTIRSGVKTEWLIFVPLDGPVEVWQLIVTNLSQKEKELSLFTYFDNDIRGTKGDYKHTSLTRAKCKSSKQVIYSYNHECDAGLTYRTGFMASSRISDGFETVAENFTGRNGSFTSPRAVKENRCTNIEALGEPLCASFKYDLLLEPGAGCKINFAAGLAASEEEAEGYLKKYLNDTAVEEAFRSLNNYKSSMLDQFVIKTPDDDINTLFNVWIKQQVAFGTRFGRGWALGTRDVMQDAAANLLINPERSRKALQSLMKKQYNDGHTPIKYAPINPKYYSDGPLWLVFTAVAYFRETGDFKFLEDVIPYMDTGEGTVLEHLLRAVRHSYHDMGEHGLVLIHGGDWNDALDKVGLRGKGESIWTSMAVCHALNEMKDLMEKIGKLELMNEMSYMYNSLKESINLYGWDGNWYMAAYDDYGNRVGSSVNNQGKVYLLPQAWAVISDIAGEERREKCFRTVDEYLECDYGTLLLNPAYTEYDENIGSITLYPPGYVENGSVYCHGTAFKIAADIKSGRGNQALKSMKKLLPGNPLNPCYVSGQEPYTTTNTFYGPYHDRRKGTSMRGWITGTGGWLLRNILEGFLGIKPDFDGIIIDPCLPEGWEDISVIRTYQGYRFHISIKSCATSCKGKVRLNVNGKPMEGNKVTINEAGWTDENIIVEAWVE